MAKYTLTAQPRDITGRKVKKLRKDGLLPASIYGKDVKSQSVQVNQKEFIKLEKQVGETGLVYLDLGGEDRPVLISQVQFHPISGLPLHADFHQVNLKEAITANVPVELVGEPSAVAEVKGILIQPLAEIEVEALPTDLPEKFEIEVSGLAEVDQSVLVKDLKVDSKVKVLSDPDQIIAKISPLEAEETAPAPVPETEGEAAAPETEGEAPAPETQEEPKSE